MEYSCLFCGVGTQELYFLSLQESSEEQSL